MFVVAVCNKTIFEFLQKLLLVNYVASGLSGAGIGFSSGIISSQILI